MLLLLSSGACRLPWLAAGAALRLLKPLSSVAYPSLAAVCGGVLGCKLWPLPEARALDLSSSGLLVFQLSYSAANSHQQAATRAGNLCYHKMAHDCR